MSRLRAEPRAMATCHQNQSTGRTKSRYVARAMSCCRPRTSSHRAWAMIVYAPGSKENSERRVTLPPAPISVLSASVCVASPGWSATNGVQNPTARTHECKLACGMSSTPVDNRPRAAGTKMR